MHDGIQNLVAEAFLDLQEALDTAIPSDMLLYVEWGKRDRGLPGGEICALPELKDVGKLCKETLQRHQNGNALTPLLHGSVWIVLQLPC